MKKTAMYLLAVMFLLASITAAKSAEETVDAKTLFEKKCSLCHSIDRPKSKQKTADGWKRTVTKMKNVNGAPVTDEEAEMIIKYLTENYGS